MPFSRKIYFNNKPLVLTTDFNAFKTEHPTALGYIHYTGAFPRHFRLATQHLSRPGTLGAVIEDVSEQSLLDELQDLYQPIDAGGGVVLNEDGAVLLIYRRGRWDLPKGKRDEGEDMPACALREVTEETGLQQLVLRDKICDTWHVYSQHGLHLLKHTAWYRMTGTKAEVLAPQAEENIQEARWISPVDLGPVLFKSYEAVREVLRHAGLPGH